MAVFLGHSFRDSKFALTMSRMLERIDVSSWIAEVNVVRNLPLSIAEGLEKCDILLCILTPEFDRCVWCRCELTYAHALGKVLYAIKLKNYEPRKVAGLFLTELFQYYTLTTANYAGFKTDTIRLLRDLKNDVNYIKSQKSVSPSSSSADDSDDDNNVSKNLKMISKKRRFSRTRSSPSQKAKPNKRGKSFDGKNKKDDFVDSCQAQTIRERGGGDDLAAGHDVSAGLRYSNRESGSRDAEDRTRLTQIWTALGDLLPQTQSSRDKKTELKSISHELKILRQEVMSLTRTIGRTSDRPANETRGDGLDPQLLVGLNQSFQQLMADNRRLSDHFTQLRDFVVQQTMRKQCTCEATNENIFNRNKGAEGHEQECGHNRPNSAQLPCDDPEMRCPEQDETWVKSTHRSGAREVRFSGNQSLKQHSGHSLVYLENDLNSQRCRSPSREVICQQGIYGDCFTNNSNGNNSRSHIPNNSLAAAFLQADNVTSRSLGTLLPHSSRNAVCSPANGSPARSQSSGKSANIPEHSFDALKETIYSEVAVFISKHENRPYYLLELIRELQKLKTDALRQQAVDSLDRIISKFLTKDQFQMQVPDEYQLKRETVGEVQLHCGSSLLYDSGIPGFSHFQGANSSDLSGVSGGVAEDEESEEEEEQEQEEEEDVDRGNISCCTDPDNLEGKEDKVLGNSSVGEEEEEERDEEGGSGSSHSTGKSDDGFSTDPDRLEDDRCMERGLESESGAEREVLDDDDDGKCSLSSTDDIHYTPDFKSETSSSCPEAETEAAADSVAAEVAEPAGNVTPTQNLDATAEQMGFVTVEFVHAPSAGRSNSENEKGSSVSDESWEKTELPEKDPEFHPTESDTSEEIVEEIIVDDCGSSGSVEELTLDQLHEKLTSISKEEIARRMTLECQGELSAQQILETIDTEPQNELARDPGAINQPASPFDKEESRRV